MGCSQSHGTARSTANCKITVSPLVAAATLPPGASIKIENAIAFLKKRGVCGRDTEQQARLFGFVRNPRLAPTLLVPYYAQCRATLSSLFMLVDDGETREAVPPLASIYAWRISRDSLYRCRLLSTRLYNGSRRVNAARRMR